MIYIVEYNLSNDLEKALIKVSQFLNGINFNRIEIELSTFSVDGKKLLKLMCYKLIEEILKMNSLNIIEKIFSDNKFIHFIKTLIIKQYFK